MTLSLTREQVRAVDRLAVERHRMTGLVLMENAGRNAAGVVDRAYGPAGRVSIFCGSGNNGGDGCVIARHLHNAGWGVRLVMTGVRERISADTAANLAVAETMPIEVVRALDRSQQADAASMIGEDDVVIDALLGTGFNGQVRTPTAELIDALNAAARRAMVAIDVPSGLDCDTGLPSNATIRADVTITFVAAKAGFGATGAADYCGRVEVVDIGTPRELIEFVQNTQR